MKFYNREINYERDLPEITELIQNNLDPSFTSEFLKWKHLKNPFGESYGRIALYEGKIVGLRLFMFWEFIDPEGKVTKGIRPVDTVTDKNYRGKGLFKRLTLEGLEECSEQYDVVFNTPNSNSLPGYLKMGWKRTIDPPYFKLGVLNFFSKRSKIREVDVKDLHFNQKYNSFEGIKIFKTEKFLQWRYSNKEYKAVIIEGDPSTYIIYKTIKMKWFKCIVIFEIFGEKSKLDPLLQTLGRKLKISFVYFLNNKEFQYIHFLKTFNRQKPIIVIKENQTNLPEKLEFSLGDLEGVL